MYGSLVTRLVEALWSWRFELGVLGYLALLVWLTAHVLSLTVAVVAMIAVLGVGLGFRRPRRTLAALMHRAQVRRQWAVAVRLGLPGLHGRVPHILSSRQVPAGDLLHVRVPAGTSAADLEAGNEPVAAVLGVRELRVDRDPDHAGRARVLVVRRDPLVAVDGVTWPHQESLELSAWQPVPVGVGEDGQPVTLSLPERNVLLGGEPGAGKSVALAPLVATAALDPTTVLWILDGKLVELATWAGCARHTVGPDVNEAVDVLATLRREMDSRYGELLANRARKITEGMGLPLHVVVIDELAFYLTSGDRKERQAFADVLRDVVARGRAAGIVVLAATQKPSSDIIPTSLRDLFGFRWALRCSTPQASDTVLGSGWASAGYNAATIDAAHRGIGYLLHEGGVPTRLRSYHLDDAALDVLSLRAEAIRAATASFAVQTPTEAVR